MATITVSDLHPTESNLTSESKSYLTDSDLKNISGGIGPLLGALAVIGTINTAVDVYYGARDFSRGFKKGLSSP